MVDTLPCCLNCANVTKYCSHLDNGVAEPGQNHGGIDLSKIITPENFRECPDWVLVGPLQQQMRERLSHMTGLGTLRMLWEIPELSRGVEQREMEDLMNEPRPDFYGMLWQGITSSERDTQLRYESDEAGNPIVETADGDEIYRARPDHQLKAYASDPEGPIKANRSKILFWSANETIDHIIRSEIEQGLVIKDKKQRKPAVSPAQQQPLEAQENAEMPTAGKRVHVSKGAAAPARGPSGAPRRVTGKPPAQAPAPAQAAAPVRTPGPTRMPAPVQGAHPQRVGPGQVGRPPVRTGAPAQAPAPVQAPAAPVVDVAAIQEAVVNAVNEAVAAARAEIDELKHHLAMFFDLWVKTGGTAKFPKATTSVDENGQELMDENGLPVQEEVLDEQGNPVYETLPCIYNKPNLLGAYIDETAYDPDPEQPAGE